MNRLPRIVVVVVFMASAGVVGWAALASRQTSGQASAAGPAGPAATQADPQTGSGDPPLRLDVQINDDLSSVLTPDTPIVITARLVNVAAREAAALREARSRLRDDAQRRVADKRLTAEQARWFMEHAEVPPPGAPYVVPVALERFSFFDTDGRPMALPWTLNMATTAAEARVDADTDAEIIVSGAPNSTAAPQIRTYRFVVSYENALAGNGRWTGTLRSEPLTIIVKDVLRTPEERAARALAIAEYHLVRKELPQVEAAVDQVLQETPASARALYLRGVVLEARGDSRGALEAYQSAKVLARRRAANGALPWDLDAAVRRMLEKNGVDTSAVIR